MRIADQQLIDETLAGSQAAFERLLRRYEKLVFRIAWSYARESEGAADIAQIVFVKLHARLGSFAGRSSFATWLARVAHNESVGWLRSQQRHTGHVELTPDNSPACGPLQEVTVMQRQRRQDLMSEVLKLNDRQRQAVMLRYFEKMSIRKVAEVLDCSEGLVKNLLFRGLQKLRERLPRQQRWNEEMGS